MKQFFFIVLVLSTALVFSYCSSSKKTMAAKPVAVAKLNYETNVQHLVTENCSPCHIPAKGGHKLALDTYDALKTNIDDIISRIEKNPGERGFMPMRGAKLSDSTISVFKQWKADGLAAK
jgi:uncharacterized membrane protein